MANKSRDEKIPSWGDGLAYFLIRITDSCHLAWALVAAFLLIVLFILTRNLESKDALQFLWSVGSREGLGWCGWFVALLEIPIARWIIQRLQSKDGKEIERLREENGRARKKLKEYKQAEFDLEP